MAHKLFKLTQKLYGTPHLVSQQGFSNITNYLTARNTNMMLPMAPTEPVEAPDDLDDISGVGVIEVCGPLTNKESGWEAICGGCSYEGILSQVDDMIEQGATCIILNMDSPGGEAYGIFLAAEEMRKKCDAAGVSLIGYVDGCCASACYALACVCDEIVANPFAEVGSIGVLIALTDCSKNMEQEGYKPVFVSAGSQKIPYAEDGSFRPEFLADLQTKVDSLYNAFAEHVSKFTGLSVEDIKATEARTFMAKDALAKGLVNQIMSNSEFVDYIVSKQMGGSTDA